MALRKQSWIRAPYYDENTGNFTKLAHIDYITKVVPLLYKNSVHATALANCLLMPFNMYAIMYILEVITLTTTTVTNFRKNIFSLVETAVRFNEPVYIASKAGNAVMVSEDEYRGLLETVNLYSTPGMKEKLIDGINTPLSDTVSEDEVIW